MANILDYLDWRGDLQISERGFNEVDNLLLAELCYLDFGGIVPPGFDAPVPLQEAMRRYDVLREHESMGVLVPDQIPELGRRMAASALNTCRTGLRAASSLTRRCARSSSRSRMSSAWPSSMPCSTS